MCGYIVEGSNSEIQVKKNDQCLNVPIKFRIGKPYFKLRKIILKLNLQTQN